MTHRKEITFMYETPALIQLGTAQETILGADNIGTDLDGYRLIQDAEFQSDIEIET